MQANGRRPHRAPDGAPAHHDRHHPEQNTLYRLAQQHTASLIAHSEASSRAVLPRFITEEFDAFFEYGILARAILWLRSELVRPARQVVQRVTACHLLGAALLKADEGHRAAVTLIQRFGSAANLKFHLHCLVLDGAYGCGAEGAPVFVEMQAPTDCEVHERL